MKVHLGDETVVLPKISVNCLEIAKTIVHVSYQLALSTAFAFTL